MSPTFVKQILLVHSHITAPTLCVSMTEGLVVPVVLCSGFGALFWQPASTSVLAVLSDNTLILSRGEMQCPLLSKQTYIYMNSVVNLLAHRSEQKRQWVINTSK